LHLKGHEQSAPAAIAAEIAAEKGKFWQFVDTMYSQPREGMKDTQPILEVAQSVGLDPRTTLDRIRDPNDKAMARLMKDIDDGSKVGVYATPTFFVIAPGVKGVRQCTMTSLWNDLELPEYQKFYKSG